MTGNGIKVAIIDLYNNEVNEGMRCIKEIVSETKSPAGVNLSYNVYETRFKDVIPGTEYDIYISSGGPGSPFEGKGTSWENKYFKFLDDILAFNQNNSDRKKYVFFICHSFQMMTRYFKFADVEKRNSKSFGVLPFNLTDAGKKDFIFENLPDPFYAADFREYHVINPDKKIFSELSADILATEYEDDYSENALMAVRISPEIAGTQFHPEADPNSMLYHFKQDERKKFIISKYGEDKYFEMLAFIDQQDKIKLTRKTVLPNFLNSAIDKLNFTPA